MCGEASRVGPVRQVDQFKDERPGGALVRRGDSSVWLVLALALLAALIAGLSGDQVQRLSGLVACATLLSALGVRWAYRLYAQHRAHAGFRQVPTLHGADLAPVFVSDAQGALLWVNPAAAERFGSDAETLMAALHDHFASPASVLYRLQLRAQRKGAAREDVVTRRGLSRISVSTLPGGGFLWRVEEFVDGSGGGRGADGIGLPMLVANKGGVVLFCNEALRRLLGGRPKHLDRILSTADPRPSEVVELAAATGPVRAFMAEVPGVGERREIFFLPCADPPGAEDMDGGFAEVPVPLLRLSREGEVIAANPAATGLLGEDVAGQRLAAVYEGLGRPIEDWLADVMAGRLPAASEVLRPRKGAADAFHQVTLRRIVDSGHPGMLVVVQDATSTKRMEAQFVQSQKMQAIGQLAGGVAHDFNNLLTAISGHCDLLLMRHNRDSVDYADLVQVQQNANRAAALVGQLLAFSRKQTLRPERLDLGDVLSDLAHLLNRLVGEKVDLRLLHGQGLGAIRADRRQLEQVIVNLVVNARDAMPEGGTIRLETEALTLMTELRRDRAVVPPGRYGLIRVTDTGLGIAPELREKIFEPFFTTKRQGEGTGLGLSTVYGIVKQSGGFVFVDSTLGEGTVFHLYFPIHDGPAIDGELAAPQKPRPSQLMRPGEGVVLLVEDEAPVRAFASRALRLRGYTVLEARDAEEALATLEDPSLEVDIFVTDVVMPGMDGPTWVRRALEQRPDVRVVFMSGYAEEAVTDATTQIEHAAFLAKPFSLNDLAQTVQAQLA